MKTSGDLGAASSTHLRPTACENCPDTREIRRDRPGSVRKWPKISISLAVRVMGTIFGTCAAELEPVQVLGGFCKIFGEKYCEYTVVHRKSTARFRRNRCNSSPGSTKSNIFPFVYNRQASNREQSEIYQHGNRFRRKEICVICIIF